MANCKSCGANFSDDIKFCEECGEPVGHITVELGQTDRSINEISAIEGGTIIILDKLAGEPVDILVNRRLVAKGEVVVVDENFGVRVTEIIEKIKE
jgi:flagellar motor switch protein FliN